LAEYGLDVKEMSNAEIQGFLEEVNSEAAKEGDYNQGQSSSQKASNMLSRAQKKFLIGS